MPKFTNYAVNTLPTTNIDLYGIYYMRNADGLTMSVYIRKADNTGWITTGTNIPVTSVNGLIGAVALELGFNQTTGTLSITGGASSIILNNFYERNDSQINWTRLTGVPNFALDANVVHKTGDETIQGIKTFSNSPIVPTATDNNQAINYGQLVSTKSDLQAQIDSLGTAVAGGMLPPIPFDASANPTFPTKNIGTTMKVTVGGTTSGIVLQVGDMIIYNETGNAPFVVQSNVDQANETTIGLIRIATAGEAITGTNDLTAMTPLKTRNLIYDFYTSTMAPAMDGKYVKFDAAQTLTAPQQVQARANINAAPADVADWGQKDW